MTREREREREKFTRKIAWEREKRNKEMTGRKDGVGLELFLYPTDSFYLSLFHSSFLFFSVSHSFTFAYTYILYLSSSY